MAKEHDAPQHRHMCVEPKHVTDEAAGQRIVPSQRKPSEAENNSTETDVSGKARNMTKAAARKAYRSASMSFFGYRLPSQAQIKSQRC